MEQKNKANKILLHSCCGICSGYPISLLKDLGYCPVVYFCNPNLDTEDEFAKRLDAQKTVCDYHNVELLVEPYDPNSYMNAIKGFENEPEKGKRCDICIKIRLEKTAQKAQELGIKFFTTSLVISPHKNFEKISAIGKSFSKNIEYISIDFKKKDGFLKTNNLSKELNLYRQNYCGCIFSKQN